MKLNLGCGADIKPGYTNVDLTAQAGVDVTWDLSQMPWPFADASADEALMLDFLEHFPYAKAGAMLDEAWRVLKPGALLEVQVPDFEHCALAVLGLGDFLCNRCGWKFQWDNTESQCRKCGQDTDSIAEAAIHRLYGGQDYEGNFHYNAFTKRSLERLFVEHGFVFQEWLEKNQNGETFYANWNIKGRATKVVNVWRDDD